MTTDLSEFSPAEREQIKAQEANARKVLGIDPPKAGEAKPETPSAPVTDGSPAWTSATEKNMAHGLEALRDQGLDPAVIAQFEANKPISVAERELVLDWQRGAMKDQTYVKELLAGNPDAQRKLLGASIALSLGVAAS